MLLPQLPPETISRGYCGLSDTRAATWRLMRLPNALGRALVSLRKLLSSDHVAPLIRLIVAVARLGVESQAIP